MAPAVAPPSPSGSPAALSVLPAFRLVPVLPVLPVLAALAVSRPEGYPPDRYLPFLTLARPRVHTPVTTTLTSQVSVFVSLFGSVFASLRIRSFRYQWTADTFGTWASEMETLLLGWYVLVDTGSPFLVGLV